MKSKQRTRKIKGSVRVWLYDLLTGAVLAAFSIVALVLCREMALLCVFYTLVLGVALTELGIGLYNIQTVTVEDGYIKVRNFLGTVKSLELTRIKRAVLTDAELWSFKGFRRTIPAVALTHKRTFRVGEVQDAANANKHPYVVIPYTPHNVSVLKEAYLEATGEELKIEQ